MNTTDKATTPVTDTNPQALFAAALARAQSKMALAKRGRENKFDNYSYPDIGDYIDACREPLASEGIARSHRILEVTPTHVRVESSLLHCSGWRESTEVVMPIKVRTRRGETGAGGAPGPTDVGAAIAYAKKYGLDALAAIGSREAEDVDEGHAPITPTPIAPTQTSAVAVIESRIESAETTAALEVIAQEIKRLSPIEQAHLRSRWTTRREALRGVKP